MQRHRWAPRALAILLACGGCAEDQQSTRDSGAIDRAVADRATAETSPDLHHDLPRDAPTESRPGDSGAVDSKVPDSKIPDSQQPDLPRDITVKTDSCVPGCHWDCFGGRTCHKGSHYLIAFSPFPCCKFSDPWPYPGPVCSNGTVIHACKSKACAAASDKRYASCFQGKVFNAYFFKTGTPSAMSHILDLECAGSGPRKVGDPCKVAADCRPAPASAPALKCDATSGKCVAAARPAAPATFGNSCGLLPGDVKITYAAGQLVKGKACSHCFAVKLSGSSSCVKQACTTPCKFDEDCPSGTVCLCSKSIWGADIAPQFCAAATSRTSDAGRTAGLKCP